LNVARKNSSSICFLTKNNGESSPGHNLLL
jgi:hypothetical protein